VLSACASEPTLAPPKVPDALQPPAGQSLFLEALANGVQIYECTPKANPAGSYEWTFRAPEAVLADRAGKSLGKHYAGPTWESSDGSSVVGEAKARDAGPDASAIPWLLLNAKSTSGNGVFSGTRSIQRVATVGGAAPTASCGALNANEKVGVPYTATYYFYRAKP
jgi:hypothetical protein